MEGSKKTALLRTFSPLFAWDCCSELSCWGRFSSLLSVLAFDAFTELLLLLCSVACIVFMALEHYSLEHDGM